MAGHQFTRGLLGTTALVFASTLADGPVSVGAASAQEEPEADDRRTLDLVVVTARRREEGLQDVPVAVTAFQGDALEARDVSDISGVGDLAPNVTLRSTASLSGSSNATAFFIRGIGQTDFAVTTDPGVGTYLDGVYIARSVGGVLDTLDVESIEVLRGPQGTLFGRNTIGGALNVRSKVPGNEFSSDFRFVYGDFDRTDFAAAVNVPVNDRLAFRLSALSQNRDGFVRRLLADVNDTSDLQGDQNSDTFRLTTRFDATDTFQIIGSADYTRVREASAGSTAAISSPGLLGPTLLAPIDVPGLGLVAPGDPGLIPEDIDTTFATGPNGTILDTYGGSITATWDIGNIELKSISAYRGTDGEFNRDGDGTPFPIGEQTRTIDFEQFSQELQANGTSFGDRLDWTAGVFYLHEEAEDLVLVTLGNILPLPGIDIDNFTNNDTIAVYGQGTYDLTDRLSVTGGIRWTNDDKQYTTSQVISAIGVTIVDGTAQEDFSAVTGRAGIEYKVTEDLLTYVSASRGFKSGGFTPRYVAPPPGGVPLTFEEETVWTYELGTKWEGFGNRARLNLAAFLSDYEDIQLVLFDGFGAPINQNGGDATIWGIEAEGVFILNEYFQIAATAGYLNAEFDNVLEPQGTIPFQPITVDSEFPNSPDFQSSVSPEFTLPLQNGHEIGLRADWIFSTDIFQTFENFAELEQDSYHLLDASISYGDPENDWSVSLGASNLTDERIIISGGIGAAPGFGDRNFNRPREWRITFKKSFN